MHPPHVEDGQGCEIVDMRQLLTTAVEMSSVTSYVVVIDGASEHVVLYRTRIHRDVVEISQIGDFGALRPGVPVYVFLADFGALGRDRGRFEVCKARHGAHLVWWWAGCACYDSYGPWGRT